MRTILSLLVFGLAVGVLGHPGGGIVALSEDSALVADPTENFIWLVQKRQEPKRLVSKFHGHWMTRGRDGNIYAEAFGERGGAWATAAFRLDVATGKMTEVADHRELEVFVFAVDRDGSLVFQRGSGLVSRRDGKETPFRSAGDELKLKEVTAYAWSAEGDLIFADRNRIRRMDSKGVTRLVAEIEGKVLEPKIWNTADVPIVFGLAVDKGGDVLATVPHLAKVYRIGKDGGLKEVHSSSRRGEPLTQPSPLLGEGNTERGTTDDRWRATGVSVFGDSIFLMESDSRASTSPRVRILRADGGIETLTVPPRVERSESLNGTKAGDEIEVRGVKFCWCPAGKFKMGSPASEAWHRPDEEQVEVTLTKGFWMRKYEVTQGEWKRVMGTTHGDLTRELNAGVGENFPVYWVSYKDAEEFCRKLTAEARAAGELPEGWAFRLPTEAQWEYACRAGTTTAYAFGDTLSEREANVGKPYNGIPTGVPGSAAAPVGSYSANAWGLHDMHGNEFEWCRDWYHAQLRGGTDPFEGETGSPNRDRSFSRVRRGGAWTDKPEFCRSAVRIRFEPHRSSDHIGFRVAITQE
jgi:formylglycine-generating enzyme